MGIEFEDPSLGRQFLDNLAKEQHENCRPGNIRTVTLNPAMYAYSQCVYLVIYLSVPCLCFCVVMKNKGATCCAQTACNVAKSAKELPENFKYFPGGDDTILQVRRC